LRPAVGRPFYFIRQQTASACCFASAWCRAVLADWIGATFASYSGRRLTCGIRNRWIAPTWGQRDRRPLCRSVPSVGFQAQRRFWMARL